MTLKKLFLVKKKISEAKSIVIAGHINPDGDSIGSLLSLGLGLKKLGKNIYMVSPDGVPKRYKLLPGAKKIVNGINKPIDLAIAVDCGSKDLLGKAYEIFKNAKSIIEIDHHEFRESFGGIEFVDIKAAAVGELIYELLKYLDIAITKDIAENLLASVIVETNSFRLPKVRPLTFEVCAKLMKYGVDFYKLVDTIFWSEAKEATILTGICLARCKFLRNGKIAWSIIRKEDFKFAKGKDEDVDAVTDIIRSIKGVEMAILFREKNNKKLRVSLRSKDKLNIAKIAEHFEGGGHFDSAGCQIPNNSKSIDRLLNSAKKLLDKGHL